MLPLELAIDVLDDAFRTGLPAAPLRSHLATDSGDLLLMPASGSQGVGVKLVTVSPGNRARGLPLIHGIYALFDPESLRPVALIDGAALTTLRTASVSAVATRYLAASDASHLVVFGAGEQARAHIQAMMAVRPVARVSIVSRSDDAAERLAAQTRARGTPAVVGRPDDVRAADLICTCTTSEIPIFDGSLLPAGCHVNGIGSHRPDARELDDATITRADAVVVESREAALAEAGDVIIPLQAGLLKAADLHVLTEVATGRGGRRGDDEITVFKSVGIASEHLVVAAAALERMAP